MQHSADAQENYPGMLDGIYFTIKSLEKMIHLYHSDTLWKSAEHIHCRVIYINKLQ